MTGEELIPDIIVAVQTLRDRINLHPYLHLLVTEGGVDRAGTSTGSIAWGMRDWLRYSAGRC